MIKTENQIYADIKGFIETGLNFLNIGGWQVLQLNQPVKLCTIKPTVYITCTQRRRRGWQYRQDTVFNGELIHTEAFKQEIDVQVSAIRSWKITDTETTPNPSDILEELKMWMLSSSGLKTLRAGGYEIYQPSEVRSSEFMNDSENFEMLPSFTITFVHEQSKQSPQAAIEEIRTKGIFPV